MDRNQRFVTLADGRRLCLAEYGEPNGRPLLYLHGLPGSRLEPAIADAAASHHGLRLVAFDRPGFGRSDPRPGRDLEEGAADTLAVADALGLDRFGLLGISGGAPHAIACAAAAPRRAALLGLVSGLGPYRSAALNPTLRLARLAGRHPWPFRHPCRLAAATVRGRPGAFLRGAGHLLSPVDRHCLAEPTVNAALAASLAEALRQGCRGLFEELVLLARPWATDFSAVRATVHLWHGGDDRLVPPAMGRWLANALPGCRGELVPGEGHFSLPMLGLEPILAALAGEL